MSKSEEVLVYFHGAFGFRTIEGYVEAYVPDIAVHVNLIGTWAGLHAMKPGFEYKLEGVAYGGQRPEMDADLNVVFEHLGAPVSAGFFCKIVVPWPAEPIQSLCPEPVDPGTLFTRITSEAGGKIPKPSQLSHIQLYRFRTDGTALRFVGRKIAASGNDRCNVAFSARADARSRPNGFSTTRRAPRVQPDAARPVATGPNKSGGIAR